MNSYILIYKNIGLTSLDIFNFKNAFPNLEMHSYANLRKSITFDKNINKNDIVININDNNLDRFKIDIQNYIIKHKLKTFLILEIKNHIVLPNKKETQVQLNLEHYIKTIPILNTNQTFQKYKMYKRESLFYNYPLETLLEL